MITNTINTNLTLNRVFFSGPTSKKPNPPLNPSSSSLHFSSNPSSSSSCKSLIPAMALHLCRRKHRFPNNPTLIHLFSTSPDDNEDGNPTPTPNRPSFNSSFSDVKASLKTQTTTSPSYSSIDAIRKNLAEFRQLSAPPPPTGESTSSVSQSPHISFQELYRRNLNPIQNNEAKPGSGTTFDAIRESLRQKHAAKTNMNDNRSNMTAGGFRNDLNSKGEDGFGGSRVIGGTQDLPISVFGREIERKKGGEKEREGLKTEFLKTYSYEELGKKLRQLRLEGGKSGEGFSLQELNERLVRLREFEKRDSYRIGGVPFRDLRESLQTLKFGEEKQKKSSGLYAFLYAV